MTSRDAPLNPTYYRHYYRLLLLSAHYQSTLIAT